MNDHDADQNVYECVEPEIGRELWRWAGPEATTAERNLRTEHLRICDACRLERAVAREVASGLTDGSLQLHAAPSTRQRVRPVPALTAGAVGLAAIGLLLTVLLPPTPPPGLGHDRSGAVEGFIRPVEGEVVGQGGPRFRWHPVRGASSYRLRVEEVAGDFTWSGESADNTLELPAAVDLSAASEYRAYLETVPRDLAPAGGLSVRFRSGSPFAVLRYRAGAAPGPARWLTLSGALLGLGAALVGTLGRRGAGGGPD